MKKICLLLALAFVVISDATAQKQIGGDKNFEMNFTPLGGSPLSINGIRLRMFNDESSAIRLNIFVGSSKQSDVMAQEGALNFDEDVPSPLIWSYDRSFDFSIRPGYEMHFDGTDRLSPYLGVEVVFAVSSHSIEDENWSPDDIDNLGDEGNYVVWSFTEKNATRTFGLGLVAGFDFYFSDNIYLGGEFGYGFASMKYQDTTYETTNLTAYSIANFNNEDEELPDPVVNSRNFTVGPTFNSAIRLGVLIN